MSMQLVLTVPAILKATQIELHPNGITESSTGKQGSAPGPPSGARGQPLSHDEILIHAWYTLVVDCRKNVYACDLF